MPALFADQHVGEFGRVGEVAVVAEADAVGRVDVEGLRLGDAVVAGRGIAHMADTDVATQFEHVLLAEDIAHQARALAHGGEPLARGHDAGGILAAVLQHRQRVIETLVDRFGTDDSCKPAH